jgi:hypothetical protein
MHVSSKSLFFYILMVAVAVSIYSCANRGIGPTGGPKDIKPPIVLNVTPPDKKTNFHGKRIEVQFNKLVQLDNPLDKIVISPPQLNQPSAVSTGRRVTVTFNDSLKRNTTYTIDFGNSIKDYNEGNVLKKFSTSFSTGSSIDTMQVGGVVLDARNLNPVPEVLAGIYTNLADSAFTHFPMLRIGKTLDNGRFSILGMKPGNYRVYALKDMDGDYKFSQTGEGIAFNKSPIHTSFKMDVYNDTIRKDSVTIDTIKQVPYVHYMPDTLALLYFHEDFFRQRLVKAERPEGDQIMLYFSAPNDTLPHLQPLGFQWKKPPILQQNLHKDTLTYWFTDTLAAKTDTLRFVLHYAKSDSVGKLVLILDTLQLHVLGGLKGKMMKHEKKKMHKKEEKVQKLIIETTKFQTNIQQTMDMAEPIHFTFSSPVLEVDSTKLHLFQKIDSLWKPVHFTFQKDEDVGLNFTLTYPCQPEQSYKMVVDSVAFRDLHGLWSDKYQQTFKVRALEEYSSLIIHLTKPMKHVVFELLDANDQVLRTMKGQADNNTTFQYVMPNTYYLRLYIDANDNGKWDTGNYAKHLQPETVYYYPEKIVLRVNWDVEEDWNPTAVPLDKQKPKILIKIKDKNQTSPGKS